MPTRVRLHADVLSGLREQLDWIDEQRDPSWAARLREDLDEALDALTEVPLAGLQATPRERRASNEPTLRRLPLRRTPFVLWYVFDEDEQEVWVLRLFHARQSRSRKR